MFKRKSLGLFIVLVLLLSMIPAFKINHAFADFEERYEYFLDSNEANLHIYGVKWYSQTFTVGTVGVNVSFVLKYVNLKLVRVGSPGNINVSFRATSGGLATGSDLDSVIVDSSTFTTDYGGAWYQFNMTANITLSAGIQYAIVVRAPSGDINNQLLWRDQSGTNSYTGGTMCYSGNSGSSWTSYTWDDFTFEVYGEGQFSLNLSSVPSLVSFTLNGTAEVTPFFEKVTNGTYQINFTSSFVREGVTWNFSYWDDDVTYTNPNRTINLQSNSTYSVTYTSAYEPIEFQGLEPVFECAANNLFELNGILEGNDTYRQMLLDSSPYENHAKLYPITHPYAGPTLDVGVMGKGLEFDGVDDSAISNSSLSLNVTEAISIEFWFNVYDNSTSQTFISKGLGSNLEWRLGLENGKIKTELWTQNGNCYYDNSSSETIESGIFYFLALTYDFRDGYYTVYLHGYPFYNVTTDGYGIDLVDGKLYLGNSLNSTLWFNGVLDEIRIYPYKLSEQAVYNEMRSEIVKFGSCSFVNSGIGTDVNDANPQWTIVEGVTDGYQGFTNNDPELPWARAYADENLLQHMALVRTIKYVAGFQSYQLYCTVKFSATDISGSPKSYIRWYWNFFRNGMLQSTYSIEIGPKEWGGTYVQQWRVVFQLTTPYYALTNQSVYTLIVNQSSSYYTSSTLPIIVSAWVGPDNKHFAVRFDVQDTTALNGGDTPPFSYYYDLVDENLNTHITDWFDGWIVSGITTMAKLYAGSQTEFSKMEIVSHKFFIIAALIITAIIIVGSALYYAYTKEAPSGILHTIVNTVTRETMNVLVPVSEVVGSAVRAIGDAVVDALSGLAHDLIGGLAGVANALSEPFAALVNMFIGLGKNIVDAFTGYSLGIVTAFWNTINLFWNTFVSNLNGISGLFGAPTFFTDLGNAILILGSWFSYTIGNIINFFQSEFTLISSFASKMFTVMSDAATNWSNMVTYGVNILDGAYGWSCNTYETLNLGLWLQIVLILYPVYLLIIWEEQGLQAVINHIKGILDVLAFIGNLFLSVIHLFIRLVTGIIESIPVIE